MAKKQLFETREFDEYGKVIELFCEKCSFKQRLGVRMNDNGFYMTDENLRACSEHAKTPCGVLFPVHLRIIGKDCNDG